MTFKPKNMLEEIMGIHPWKYPNMSGKYNREDRSKPMEGYTQFVFLKVLNVIVFPFHCKGGIFPPIKITFQLFLRSKFK